MVQIEKIYLLEVMGANSKADRTYFSHWSAPGKHCIKYCMVGWENPKNSGPDPVFVVSLPRALLRRLRTIQ